MSVVPESKDVSGAVSAPAIQPTTVTTANSANNGHASAVAAPPTVRTSIRRPMIIAIKTGASVVTR